jgi:MFS family permease/F0F1-type ATP synthase assembly protein I
VAAAVYLFAVLQRTSLGVAGLLAERRFHITPAQLSVFVFVQLGVYAGMQIPTGILVDRYGPRRLLVAASTIMGTAQLLFALVPSYPVALAARALLGCGDALTFVSVLRFVATHFSPRRYPLLVALTATVGTLGNVAATLPLAVWLRSQGWAIPFGTVAVLSLVMAVAALALIPDNTPPRARITSVRKLRAGASGAGKRVGSTWSLPGTRLGFWVHFACMSSATAYGVLWGGAYLVKGAGFSSTGAGAVLMTGVLTAAMASVTFGAVIARRPALRVPVGLVVCMITIAGWLGAIFGFGDTPPRGYIAVLFVVMMLGGPASMAAFAVARDFNGERMVGTASGVVNVGGFLATIVVASGIGWVLDAMGSTDPHTLRWAALVGVGVQAFGTVRAAVWMRRVRGLVLAAQARGEWIPARIVRHRWDLGPPVTPLDEGGLAASDEGSSPR